jgi:hypothetical protein
MVLMWPRSARYTHSGIMFLTKVVLGNIKTVSRFAEVIGCPPGYQSVGFKYIVCVVA